MITTQSGSKVTHIYAHPALKYPITLVPGTVVEHKYRPGIPMVVVSGPEKGISGEIYWVKTPSGETVQVLRKNLKI